MQEIIESVGIDIGTSTTQLIFSRLVIENLAGGYSIPKINIVDKEIVYRSEIHTTPLLSESEIDAQRVSEIVRSEYQRAGKSPRQVQTGAVIITGETARKKNANAVLEALSAMAGEFVVATAGPDLESILSGRGAGTDDISEEKRTVVANLDIGGGTTNIAVFDKGVVSGVACLDIGHCTLSGTAPEDMIRTLGARLEVLHVQDTDGAHDLHVLPFMGGWVDWKRVCTALADVKYPGSFSFEADNFAQRVPASLREAAVRFGYEIGQRLAAWVMDARK